MREPWFAALEAEIARQDAKHGPFEGTRLGRSRLALACLEDEVAEALQAWRDERKADEWDEVRAEVLQVAAVAMRALRDAFPWVRDVNGGVPNYAIAEDFPELWKLAQQHDFRERLGGDRDPVSCEVDGALRELWEARRSRAEHTHPEPREPA